MSAADTRSAGPDPDDELLEFLGGVDELNDDAGDEGFHDYLAASEDDELEGRRVPKDDEHE